MEQSLISLTSLPNLHPALVHFPIVLLPLALVFDLVALVWGDLVWLHRMATCLYVLGVIGAGGAYWTGQRAADGLSDVSAAVQVRLAEHSDWALYTLWTFAILVALRLGIAWKDRGKPVVRVGPLRLVTLVAAMFGQWLLLETAARGGALVYLDGVGVTTASKATRGCTSASAESHPLIFEALAGHQSIATTQRHARPTTLCSMPWRRHSRGSDSEFWRVRSKETKT